MRTVEFKSWLNGKIKDKPISDCVSRCHKVEKALDINLDEEYLADKGERVLSLLQYSISDERNGKPANTAFGFRDGAAIRFRYTNLRSAVNKYFKFCREINQE